MTLKEWLSPDYEKLRQRYNPLRNLDVSRLNALLDAATDKGEQGNLQYLLSRAIKRWHILRALRGRRKAAITRMEWRIELSPDAKKDGSTKAMAEAQADALKVAYSRIGNLSKAFGFMAYAEFAGFAHLQKHRDTAGNIVHLEPLPQWCWVRDGMYGDWYWNPGAQPIGIEQIRTKQEAQIKPEDFLIRECEEPLYEAVLPA